MSHRIQLRARGNQHYAYAGRSLLVTNLDGWITGAGTEGFYAQNTRFLSREELSVEGAPLRPASVSPVEGDGFLAYYELPRTAKIPARTCYLTVRRRVAEGLRTELAFTNYSRSEQLEVRACLHVAADFADSDEAETGIRRQNGPVSAEWHATEQQLLLRYLHPSLDRTLALTLHCDGVTGVDWADGGVDLSFSLPARATHRLVILAEPVFDGEKLNAPGSAFPTPLAPLASTRQRLRDDQPGLRAANATVERAWATATADLASLPLGLEDGAATPAAGLPLYQQFFGRDSLTISWQALMTGSGLLRDSLLANSAWQGTRVDDRFDEEPGKLIHQARWGPLSLLGLDPFQRYYGDWATPVDFLAMLGEYLAWSNDRETARRLLPAARSVLAWIDGYGDLDRDGFLEYRCRAPQGVKHQGWKDSDDAVVNSRGETVEPPIAACEIQGYWYAGLQLAAGVFALLGDAPLALSLFRKARGLKRRFNQRFWLTNERFYAMGLDPQGRPIDAISSNPGHLLITGIVPRQRARVIAQRLLASDMFSGWGIRTLSAANPFYNPFSYHRGSVWPVEQGTVALGLARYGLWRELHTLAEGVFALSELFVENRLPEVVSGLPRDEQHPHPGIYPYSCEPQGWSASAVVMTVQALLGLHPIAPLGLLLLDPHLPAWLPDIRLKGLRVGGSVIDLHCWRSADGKTKFEATRREGRIRCLRQPPPNAGVGLGSRLLAAARSP